MYHVANVTPAVYEDILSGALQKYTDLYNDPRAVPLGGDVIEFRERCLDGTWEIGRTLCRDVVWVASDPAPYGQHPNAVRWTALLTQ